MNISQFLEKNGFDPKTFDTIEPEDMIDSPHQAVLFYPGYMESTKFYLNEIKNPVDCLKIMEEMMVEHRKYVNADISRIRKCIRRYE